MARKLKILFFAEGATLAHVARPLLLASLLDPDRFEPVVCRPSSFAKVTQNKAFSVRDLNCQDSLVFVTRLSRGQPLYDFWTLNEYVNADLKLIDEEKPDVIIGDFRLSLSVSARLRGIPFITICDAYWSPERELAPPLPVMKATGYLPLKLAEWGFKKIAPIAFKIHAHAFEQLRQKFGLSSLGHDLRACYTDADLRLFANFPALFPEIRTTPQADFIGPIAWSPASSDGVRLDFPDTEKPLTYLTMGSSGNPDVINKILPILESLDHRIVVSTSGKSLSLSTASTSTKVFDFVPGQRICQIANLVICNGGSPTTNQALCCGIPVLGIAENMDQFLNMETIVKYGAGKLIRADRPNVPELVSALQQLTEDSQYSTKAQQLAATFDLKNVSHLLEQHIFSLTHRQ